MDKTMLWLIGIMTLSFVSLVYAENQNNPSGNAGEETEKATFAGGCFWCMESPYDKLEGVIATTVGIPEARKRILLMKKYVQAEQGMLRPLKSVTIPPE